MRVLDEAILELAAKQYGAFSRWQAINAGATPDACHRRLQAGRWCPGGYAGVYLLAGHAQTWHQRLVAATLAGPPGTVASHRAAAVLHTIREGMPIELTVPPGGTNRVGTVMIHRSRLDRPDRLTIAGIPVTAVDRTLVDLAAVVGDEALEQALEAALRRGLTTDVRVRRRLEELAAPGRAGVARLRRLLDRRAEGRAAGSELEVRLLQLLRAGGLPEPVRQFEIVIGGQRYFIDIAYPLRRLAIELDGREAHGDEQFQTDRTRQNALVLAGWAVLRFTWADVMHRPADVMALISEAA
ncbi:MAG: DUF559 domain-containing protein [Acidimicrobiales bacterium]